MNFEIYIDQITKIYQEAEKDITLSESATDDEINDIEKETGLKLDVDLKSCWEKHNGGADYTPVFAINNSLTGYDFLSTQTSLHAMKSMKQRANRYPTPPNADPRIQNVWFANGWIPFGNFGGGSLLLMSDLSPSCKGTKGQIIGYVHDPDEIIFVASSLEAFLSQSLDGFKDNYEEYLDLY